MKKKFLISGLLLLALLAGCATGPKTKGQISVYTRDASSGTRSAFFEFIGINTTTPLTASAIEVSSSGDMADKVANDENGIGYTTLNSATTNPKLLPLSYNGVVASVTTVLNGTYGMIRPFNLVTRASGDFASPQQEAVVLAFVDYLMNSKEGREVVFAAEGIINVAAGTAWDTLKVNHPILSTDLSKITIKTGGSTSVDKTLTVALQSFSALTGVKFEMNQTGSSDGYKRTLGSDKDSVYGVDIGFASRDFTSTEVVSKGAVSGAYCTDAVVVVVNKANDRLKDANKALLNQIYSGSVNTWEKVTK